MRKIIVLAVSLCIFLGCDSDVGHSPSARMPEIQKDAKTDAEKILDTWTSVRYEANGVVDPLGAGGKAVFEKKTAYIHGLEYSDYKLDSQQRPKHIGNDLFVGIYRLDADSLSICIPSSSFEKQRPTSFATKKDDGLMLFVFKRAHPVDLAAPDAKFDADLVEKLRRGIAIFESRDLRELGKWLGQPIPDGVPIPEVDERVKQRMNRLAATYKVLLKVTPKFNSNKDTATFDISGIHIEGGIVDRWWFNFVKRNGEWFFINHRPPLVE